MRVAQSRLNLRMSQEASYHLYRHPTGHGNRGIGMAQIVNPHVIKPRKASDAPPRSLHFGDVGVRQLALDDIRVASRAREGIQNRAASGGQRDAPFTHLAIGQL